jgi:hypothetical protein
MLRIWRLRLPEGCAEHSDQTPYVKGKPPPDAISSSVAGFRPFGERFCNGGRAWLKGVAPGVRLRIPGVRLRIPERLRTRSVPSATLPPAPA